MRVALADKAQTEQRGPYYGWWVLAAAAMGEMLAQGSTSYAAGLFVKPLGDELHLSRADANSSLALLYLGGALFSPLAGYALDRYPARIVIAMGAVSMGIGLSALGATSSLLVMAALIFLPVAFGFVAIGPMTATTLASRWFYRRRGRALGLAAIATSGGGAIVVPFLSLAIDSFGWRAALMLEGIIIAFLMGALSLLVIRDAPSPHLLATHAENAGRAESDAARSGARISYRAILSNTNFWALMAAMAILSAVIQAIVTTAIPYATDLGFNNAAAAGLVAAVSVAGAVTKLASGVLADHVDRRAILFAAGIALAAALALLMRTDYISLFAACCLVGIALGCELPSSGALIADCFGSRAVGTVIGLIYVFIGFSVIASVRFAGAMFDRTGNYHAVFLVFLILAIVAALAALFVRPARAPTTE